MDAGQFLSFISGYRKATKLPKTSQAKINEFLRKANDDLRDVIENATPALIVLDTQVYQQACQEFVQELRNPESSTRQFIESLAGGIRRDDLDFESELQSLLNSYRPPQIDINQITSKIATKQHTLEEFSDIVSRAFNSLNSGLAAFMPGIQAGDAAATGKARYRVTAAGRAIRTEFARKTPCKLKNAGSIVENFNPATQEIFLGATFATLRSAVNNVLTPIIRKSFSDSGIFLAEKSTDKSKINKNTPAADINRAFTIGEIVVFGHTGAKSTDPETGAVEIVGFISPWIQQIMLLAAQSSEPQNGTDIINGFVNTSGQVNYSVQFSKQVSPQIKTLMQAQLAVVVPMTVKTNKTILQGETQAADQIIQNLFGTTYRKLRSSLIDRVLSADNLRRLVTGLKFSPTLIQSLEVGFVELLKTGKFKTSSKATSKKAEASVTAENIVKLNLNKGAVKKVKLPTTTLKSKATRIPKSKTVQEQKLQQEVDLLSLQNLLNINLVQTVKQNMGTGTRKDVLNLRSGRFAESVQVERLTQSREGTVTAFYNYMRNPYATFSQGGKQQYPRSRDPKTLISKSIREVAQQLKISRLRAVLV